MILVHLQQPSYFECANNEVFGVCVNVEPQMNIRVTELIRELNLTQLISESAHSTEDSSSILDLILVLNRTNILYMYSGVSDPFTQEQVRHHRPTIVLMKSNIQTASFVL